MSANLAQRLIQVHMCVIYLFAGISKLQGPSWWSGEAMWRAFANLEYQSLDMTWLAWHPWLVNIMSHVSVLWEIAFCVLIWKPLWRPLMLAGRGGASRRDRRLPGNVDLRADHAGWLRVVFAQRGDQGACGRAPEAASASPHNPVVARSRLMHTDSPYPDDRCAGDDPCQRHTTASCGHHARTFTSAHERSLDGILFNTQPLEIFRAHRFSVRLQGAIAAIRWRGALRH